MNEWTCPVCGVQRPHEVHLDWCTWDGDDDDDTELDR